MDSRIGFTHIKSVEGGLRITHGGNMGNSIDQVRVNVDEIMGEGAFDALRKSAGATEEGSPDYWYVLFIPDA